MIYLPIYLSTRWLASQSSSKQAHIALNIMIAASWCAIGANVKNSREALVLFQTPPSAMLNGCQGRASRYRVQPVAGEWIKERKGFLLVRSLARFNLCKCWSLTCKLELTS